MNRSITIISMLCLITLFGCSEDAEFDTAAVQAEQALGWRAYDQGNFSSALLSFERAINLDPSVADAHNGLGWSHLSASQVSATNPQIVAKAQAAFEEAIRLAPSNADAWIGLANTLFLRRQNASDFQTALRAIDNALKADHSTLFRHDYRSAADVHTLRAACYYYLGRADLARSAIDQALKIEPQNAAALSLRRLIG